MSEARPPVQVATQMSPNRDVPAPGVGASSVLRSGLALGAIGLFAFLVCIPWWTGPNGTDADSASDMAIHIGFVQGWDFGKDIAWPFGPYGFLYSKSYYPRDYAIMLLAWAFTASAFVMALFVWSRGLSERLLVRAAATLLGIALTTVALDTIFLLLLFLVLVLHFDRNELHTSVSVLLAAAIGLAALIKFPLFVLSVVMTVAIGMDGIIRHRRPPIFCYLCPGFVLLFWMLARQPILSIIPFVTNRLLISMSYTQAMAKSGPWKEVVAFVATALVTFGIGCYIELREKSKLALIPISALAVFLFVIFKEGFVRHDEHAVIASSVLVFVALHTVRTGFRPQFSPSVRVVSLASLAASAAQIWLSMGLHTEEGLVGHSRWLLQTMDDRAAAFSRFVGNPQGMEREFAEHLDRIRSESHLPDAVSGSIDIYPYGQTELVAGGFDYSPRPVIQSYMTYNGSLAEINAAHLRGPRSPEHIFFRAWPIDLRFPSLDDSLSWFEILKRYAVVKDTDDVLWLRRRPVPVPLVLERIWERTVHFDEEISVSASETELLWAEIDIQPTLRGRAATFFFKPPWVFLIAERSDGTTHNLTLVPDLSRSGFLLSPIVLDHHQFAELIRQEADGAESGRELKRFRLSTSQSFYRRGIRVALYRVDRGTGGSGKER